MSLTLSLHTRHDANMTISSDSDIIRYIEFEKITGQRYFRFSEDNHFSHQIEHIILPLIRDICGDIKKINVCWLTETQKHILKGTFPDIIFEEKKHHLSHAYSLYAFTKVDESDLIISFDGGGDENDSFKIFGWNKEEIELLEEYKLNLGTPYRMLGLISPEINSNPQFEYNSNLHLSGKIMGLAPLGEIKEIFIPDLINFYKMFKKGNLKISDRIIKLLDSFGIKYDDNLKVETVLSRNILRTSQEVFEQLFMELSHKYIASEKYQRILLTGGCAFNIRLNTVIYNKFAKEIFVSPVSGDCGISIGAAISDIYNKTFNPFNNAYIGPTIKGNLSEIIEKYKGRKISESELAKLLFDGKIIAIMIGKIEAGPRALGNRSILANPLIKGIKDKLNKIKYREFFRPVAPIITERMQNVVFESCPISKYMTFSPSIKKQYSTLLSEVVHYDGTCRIQTVTENETFLHELLVEFGKLTGIEVLANTSFNSKGKPIINDTDEAIDLFLNTEIDFLYIDGNLFDKKTT